MRPVAILTSMVSAAHIRELVAYNRWANDKVFGALEHVSDDALSAARSASRGSLFATVAHIATSQVVWLTRFTGATPPAYDFATRTGVIHAVDAAQTALEAFAAGLAADDWDRLIEYRDSSGAAHSVPLGRLLTHLVNHGTLHRGEARFQLGELGHSPGDMDYVLFTLGQGDER